MDSVRSLYGAPRGVGGSLGLKAATAKPLPGAAATDHYVVDVLRSRVGADRPATGMRAQGSPGRCRPAGLVLPAVPQHGIVEVASAYDVTDRAKRPARTPLSAVPVASIRGVGGVRPRNDG